MSERVLITGGAGYIGSILIPELLRSGRSVTVLDNFRFGQSSLMDCCANKNLDIVRGDARDIDTLRPLVAKPTARCPSRVTRNTG